MKKKKVAFKEKGPKDDGSRWAVIGEDGRRVYQGDGIKKSDAQRLANRLVQSATIEMVTPPTEG
jgi:hypothetical protein